MSLLAPPFVTLTPFASLTFYVTGTLTLASIYADSDLTTPLRNPLKANSAGLFVAVYLDPAVVYRVIASNAFGVVVSDTDPVTPIRDLSGPDGATLVGYKAQGTGTVARTLAAKLQDILSVKDFGAVGDGVTDDTAALSAMVTAVNAGFELGDPPVTIVFPAGTYKFSATLGFDRPVTLIGASDATLNYTGTGYAIRLGPTNLLNSPTAFSYQEMTIDGLRFTGGTAAAGGIYISDSILEPRLRNLTFIDFGVAGSWCIYGQANNWNTLIENCRVFSLNRLDAAPSFININGVSVDTTPDGGNSRVTVRDCFMTSYNETPMGVFARLNAVACRVVGGGAQWASTAILLSPAANGTIIDDFYCEIYTANSQMIGYESLGSGSTYQVAQDVKLRDAYCNLHQSTGSTNARVIKPVDGTGKMVGWTIEGLTVSDITAGYTIIEQNNLTGQVGNSFSGLKTLFVPGAIDDGSIRPNFPQILANNEPWACADGKGAREVGESFTLTREDANRVIICSGGGMTITIPPSNAHPYIPVGSTVRFRNVTGGNQTIAPGAGVSLVMLAGGPTRTLASNGFALLTCTRANEWMVEGMGVS